MKVEWQSIESILVDPVDHSPLRYDPASRRLASASAVYGFVAGQPALLSPHDRSSAGWRFPPISLSEVDRPKPSRPRTSLVKRARRRLRSDAMTAPRSLAMGLVRTMAATDRQRVLVVGGATVGEGAEAVVDSADVDLIAFDVYPTQATTFVADGHRIPLADGSVSLVWVQAVLEHVYRPDDVVTEIARVLGPGGLVYAETPFLQPVHEGAYDYQRFTLAGHRLLFPQFDEVDSGPIGGPGAVVSLAVRTLVGGLTRSPFAARVAYALTQPLVLLDRLVPVPWRIDACTGAWFLGRLADGGLRTFDPVETYRGAQ